MSGEFDRFLAGEGPLAELIRALPAYTPPPHMEARLLAALEAAAAPTGFEPPVRLEAAVMAEAARLDAAQVPRRAALLEQIAAGRTAGDALGAEVSAATDQWLRGQRRTPPPAPHRRRRWPWLAGLAGALSTALALSVALRVLQAPQSAAPPPVEALGEVVADAAPAEQRARMAPRAAAPARGMSSEAMPFAAREAAPAAKAERRTLPAAPPPAPVLSVPLATPAAGLAERVAAHPEGRWRATVSHAELAEAAARLRALAAELDTRGRHDEFMLTGADGPTGSLHLERLSPADRPAPPSPAPRPSAGDGAPAR